MSGIVDDLKDIRTLVERKGDKPSSIEVFVSPEWKYSVYNEAFNEGVKGVAKGKLAGNMNTNSGSIKIGDANIIQQILMILDFVERRLQDISGITPQRKGAVENRETLGGVDHPDGSKGVNEEMLKDFLVQAKDRLD